MEEVAERSVAETLNNEEAKIRVLVVDDHQVVREGLRALLKKEADIMMVGEAAEGASALKQVTELSPDVVLMDIKIPAPDGFKVARDILAIKPDISIIMLTGYDNALYVAEALGIGARGLITKDSPGRLLSNAIRVVADGGSVWMANVLDSAMKHASTSPAIKKDSGLQTTPESTLTERERRLISYMAQGLTNKEMAAKMELSVETIKKCNMKIMRKLGLKNRVQSASIAFKLGL